MSVSIKSEIMRITRLTAGVVKCQMRPWKLVCLVIILPLALATYEFCYQPFLDTTDTSLSTPSSLISHASRMLRRIITNDSKKVHELCDETPPYLGPITVNKTRIKLEMVQRKFPEVYFGGYYRPPNCTARQTVAIIVPYRNRRRHLAIFLNNIHPFLMKQQIEYGIFIIEQTGNNPFNRAKLMNVGFMESQRLKEGGWQCFIFHDIDLLPLDSRNMYSCPRQPRHMSAIIDKFKFQVPYDTAFGGVSAMTLEQFTKVNGFSNKYWGWGGEDDDMSCRLAMMNYHIARYKMSIARYTMLIHKKAARNPKRYQLLSQTNITYLEDGLSTLEYELLTIAQYHLFTHVIVNIDEPQ